MSMFTIQTHTETHKQYDTQDNIYTTLSNSTYNLLPTVLEVSCKE